MDAATTKDILHLRIEQADEKLLAVLAELTETLFRSYQPEVIEESEEVKIPEWAKPLTPEESLKDLQEGVAQYEAGKFISLEDSDKEARSW